MRQRLTDRSLRQKPPATGQTELWDTVVPGLACRISYGGRRTFTVMTRINKRQIRRTVGHYPNLSLSDARDKAREMLADAAKGIDPKDRERQERQEAQRAQRHTFGWVAEAFMADHGSKLRTASEYQRKIDVEILPTWGDLPISEITRADVRDLIRNKAITAPVAANRLLALVSRIFMWALDEDIITASPAVRIGRAVSERERERVLTDDELRSIWLAADRIGYPVGHLVKILILTAQRRGEVAGLTWDEIDGDWWKLSGDRSKTGSGHSIPLSPQAVRILADAPHVADLVFTARGGKLGGWAQFKTRIDRVIVEQRGEPIENWRFHDIRRTVATGLRGLGFDRLVVSKLLNHAEAGITRVYDRYSADPEKRVALEAWSQHVNTLVSGEAALSNVVEMNRSS